jgi:predicted nucleic acid-binding Zn ribbon protein
MGKKPQQRTSPEALSGILEAALKSLRTRACPELDRVWEVWDKAAGAAVARRAKPWTVKGGLLIVRVASAAWCQELEYQKEEIRARLNQELGAELVKEIRFKAGLLE